MKSTLLRIVFTLAVLVFGMHVGFAQEADKGEEEETQGVKTLTVDPGVVITMCLESGTIVVAGVDSREVRVNAEHPGLIAFHTAEQTKPPSPPTRLEIIVSDSPKADLIQFGECRGNADLDLEVPRGATVYVKTREGDIDISNVTEVRAETSTGSVSIQRVLKATEASTVSGDILLEESNGRIRLRSISGTIDVSRAKALEPNDFLYAKTISGDVRLEQIGQARVEAGTITGEITFTGPLAQAGYYDFKTTTGDITLNMPDTVSFQVTAKVSQGGEVITDFPLKYSGGLSTRDAMSSGKLAGSYGAGSAPATINLVSFSGTLRLRKK